MNCTVCKKPIVLVPSASERAAKFGGKPADYTALFTSHPDCAIRKYHDDSVALMRRIVAEAARNGVLLKPRYGI
jgi:hypothetical protein